MSDTSDIDALCERLLATVANLRCQSDLARRVAETYAPERKQWEQEKGDERLTAMIRYQLDQEQLARFLGKDADDAEQACATITALRDRLEKAEGALGYVVTAFADKPILMRVFRPSEVSEIKAAYFAAQEPTP